MIGCLRRRRVAARLTTMVAALVGMSGTAAADVELAPGQPLERTVVERLLVEPLTGVEAEDTVEIRIEEPDLPLVNRASQPIVVSLTSLRRDEATGRFTAQLVATLAGGASSRIHVAGTVAELVDLPVLARPLAAGETVRPADIVWTRMALPRQQRDTLLELDAIVGLEARRPLPAERPLRARDLRAPLLVQRGEPVTVRFSTGGLEITAAGIALEVGHRGEVVQVKNPSSGEIRRGVVEARQRVRVGGLVGGP